ncbi:SurA N-terminal domain-containing protein [Rhodovibrionaceae bacterium A322]
MEKLRGIVAKVLVIFLFSLLILSFAFWGVGDMLQGNLSEANVAEVGDEEISQYEYRQAFATEFGQLQRRFGGQLDLQTAQALGLSNQVLARLANQALFRQNSRDFNLQVSDDQVRNAITTFPAFQDSTGRFDRARYDQVLASTQMSEAQFVADMRADINRNQIMGAMTQGTQVPALLADKLYRFQNEARVANYLMVPASRFDGTALPGSDVLMAFYEDNTDNYMAPDYRSLSVVQLRPEPLAAEISVSEEDLRAEYDARLADFTVEEKRDVSQILLPSEEAAAEAAARLADGLTFDALAEEVTGQPAVSLGKVTRNDLNGDMAAAAFELAAGETSGPVQSPFGWHLLQVSEIETGSQQPFEEVRDQVEQDLRLNKAIDALVNLANDVDDELGSGASVVDAAGKFDLPVQKVDAMDAQGLDMAGNPIADLPQTPDFLAAAFGTPIGEQSLLIEAGDGGYFMLQAEGETPAAPRPFEEVKQEVEAAWLADEQLRLAEELADELAGKVEGGTSLNDLAAETGLELQTTAPLTRVDAEPSPTLTATLFDSKTGDAFVAPVEGGTLVAVMTEVIPANPASDSDGLAALSEELTGSLQADIAAAYRQGLGDRYQVLVNQQVLDSTLAQF